MGAALDANIGSVFKPLVQAARAARQAIEDEMARAYAAIHGEGAKGKGGQGPYRTAAAEAQKAADKIVAIEQRKQARITRDQMREEAKRRRDAERENKRGERERAAAERRRVQERVRDWKRGEATKQKEGAGRIRSIASGSVGTMGAIGRGAIGVTGGIARGAGVDLDIGNLVGKAVQLEKTATDVTTSAFAAKGQVAGVRDVETTVNAIRNAGDAAAVSYTDLATGLSDFVSKSADLETGKKTLADLGLIARATGTEVGSLISAAGDVAKTLDDSPDKAERLLAIMRLVAKQGAMGNVEIKDLASYMGRVTASAFMYEGSIDSNIGILGALAQTAMKGGATSAAEGTNAAQSFARDITKGAALKRFEGEGIDVFANKEKTKLLSPEKIITQFLQKTGGNLADLSNLFQNEMSKKVIKGISQKYSEAGGGEKGIEAVHQLFKDFQTELSPENVKKAADLSKGTKAGQAQAFQNQLEKLGAELASRTLPALQQMSPHILKAAEGLVKLISIAAENPGTAIVAAITASIGKAAIGTAVSGVIGKLIEGAASKMSGKASLALGAATMTIATATIAAQYLNEKKDTGAEVAKREFSEADVAVAAAEKEFKEKGTVSADTMQALDNARRHIVQAEIEAKGYQAQGGDERYKGVIGGARQAFDVATTDTTFEDIGRQSEFAGHLRELSQMRQSIDAMKQAMDTNAKRTQKVEVVGGLPGASSPGPQANTSNTTK